MISAIIINYHSDDITVSFIKDELLRVRPDIEQSGEQLSIVVVDNGFSGPDSSLDKAFDGIDDIAIIHSEENLGFAKGNNLGFKVAMEKFSPSLILFANNDIHLVTDDVISVLAWKLKSLPDAGAIGPKVTGLDGLHQSPQPFQPFWKRHILLYWGNLFMSKDKKDRILQLDYPEKAQQGWHYMVSGCFFMVDAKDYELCGGMDPNTFLYSEEAILSERLKATGKKVWYCPEVEVIHEHGKTTGKYYNRVKVRDMKFRSECYYYKTYIHTPGWQIALARLTLSIKKLLRR